MIRYVLRRLLGIVVVLLLIAIITFVVFYLLPSNPAQLSCGKPCTPDRLASVLHFEHLDLPIYVQFGEFLVGIVAGRTFGEGAGVVHCAAPCFGYSFQQGAPVTQLIGERFPVTASIAVGAAILWLLIGVTIGVISAVRRGSLLDRSTMVLALGGVSAPTYLVGLLGILIFGFGLNMVPVNGYVPFFDDPVQWAWHLVLPWCTLAFVSMAVYARLTRNQMLEVLGEDYIVTARAKGLTERRVVIGHGLRAVLAPIATVFGLDLGSLLGGAVITESVFGMQGMGQLLIQAVNQLDLPLVVGLTLFSGFLIIVANLVVDVAYVFLDPRVSYEQ
ncbi:ABC transporter permease [Fodinicola acaciae]|uniref:ABC transporter permease n=1 Tax=Fodinicola acaciae TaxID=2681555 RepID=UPI0013D86310|nr:ABC transporter permease [Fodinicola acaciae]